MGHASLSSVLEPAEKLMELTGIGVARWDMTTDEYSYSDKYCELLGYAPGTLETTHRSWLAQVFPDDQENVGKAIQSHIDNKTIYNVNCRLRTSFGIYRWFRICGQLNENEKHSGKAMSIAIIDISPLVQLENEIRNSRMQLKNLTLRVIDRQESERKHIARELHDEIGQVLTAVKINLLSVKPHLDHPPSATKLANSLTIVDDLAGQVRNLSRLLRPPQLDALGLLPALSAYLENRIRSAGLIVNLNCDPNLMRLQPDMETNCFRMVQEAMTNVLRHANATTVSIELRCFERDLLINIKDDGVGFDVTEMIARTARGECLGLFGIEERAELMGGKITFFSGANEGTNIEIRLPLQLAKPRSRVNSR